MYKVKPGRLGTVMSLGYKLPRKYQNVDYCHSNHLAALQVHGTHVGKSDHRLVALERSIRLAEVAVNSMNARLHSCIIVGVCNSF